MTTIIFTDGSSRGNPGPGGWGAVIISDAEAGPLAHVTELGGSERMTTNNRMEISAAIEALSRMPRGSDVAMHTDSSYLINGATKWMQGWKRNGWQTRAKEDVLNRDLWEKLDTAASGIAVVWKYVGGHVGVAGNERCDKIATACADGVDPKLYEGALSGYALPEVLDVSHNEERAAGKSSRSSRSRMKAYSYISRVGGRIETHPTWAECEKRVKGVKGARFKKALNAEDEEKIIAEFSSI